TQTRRIFAKVCLRTCSCWSAPGSLMVWRRDAWRGERETLSLPASAEPLVRPEPMPPILALLEACRCVRALPLPATSATNRRRELGSFLTLAAFGDGTPARPVFGAPCAGAAQRAPQAFPAPASHFPAQ